MNDQTVAPVSADETSRRLQQLRSEMETLRAEMEQTEDIWKNRLASERNELNARLESQRIAGEKESEAWRSERQTITEKLKSLDEFYAEQLATAEQQSQTA